MDYDAMDMDMDTSGPSVKISEVSSLGIAFVVNSAGTDDLE